MLVFNVSEKKLFEQIQKHTIFNSLWDDTRFLVKVNVHFKCLNTGTYIMLII